MRWMTWRATYICQAIPSNHPVRRSAGVYRLSDRAQACTSTCLLAVYLCTLNDWTRAGVSDCSLLDAVGRSDGVAAARPAAPAAATPTPTESDAAPQRPPLALPQRRLIYLLSPGPATYRSPRPSTLDTHFEPSSLELNGILRQGEQYRPGSTQLSSSSSLKGHSEQALDRDRSASYIEGECSYRRAGSVRRFNVGGVRVLSSTPASSSGRVRPTSTYPSVSPVVRPARYCLPRQPTHVGPSVN
jgi:hypothetical protein